VFKREERDGAGAHNLVYWYEYDGMGRLTHETVSGESDLETWYEYDGWLLTGRYVKTTDLTERWIEHHIV